MKFKVTLSERRQWRECFWNTYAAFLSFIVVVVVAVIVVVVVAVIVVVLHLSRDRPSMLLVLSLINCCVHRRLVQIMYL